MSTTAPQRICFVSRFTEGGSAISLRTLIDGLDRSRFEPSVLFYSLDTPEVYEALERDGVPVFALRRGDGDGPRTPSGSKRRKVEPKSWLPDLFRQGSWSGPYLNALALRDFRAKDRKFVAPLRQFFREHPADLIHLNNGLHSHRATLLATRRLRIPTLCHVRSLHRVSALDRYLARDVARFIYISRAVEERYQSCGLKPSRGGVIHNVTRTPQELSAEEKKRVRAEFGVAGDDVLVVNIGRLVPWKGQDVFLDAVRQLGGGCPRLRSLLVGGPDDNPRSRSFAAGLEQQLNDPALKGAVQTTGHREDVPALMAAADLVVHTATEPEPFGRVIIEGMAAGSAVIGAAAGGVPDIIEDGVNGRLVPPRNSEALASALRSLAEDAELRQRLAVAGKRHVLEHFTVEAHVAEISSVYERCLGRPEAIPVGPS